MKRCSPTGREGSLSQSLARIAREVRKGGISRVRIYDPNEGQPPDDAEGIWLPMIDDLPANGATSDGRGERPEGRSGEDQ